MHIIKEAKVLEKCFMYFYIFYILLKYVFFSFKKKDKKVYIFIKFIIRRYSHDLIVLPGENVFHSKFTIAIRVSNIMCPWVNKRTQYNKPLSKQKYNKMQV